MDRKKRQEHGRLAAMCAVLWMALAAAAGCASASSDIPWNEPQPWEGTIGVPGMSGAN